MKWLNPRLILVISILGISGFSTYLVALLGMQFEDKYIDMIVATPIATVLILVGVSGFCLMTRIVFPVWRHPHLQLLFGFVLVLFSWVWLDTLLMMTMSK